jgi:hypothetical protein
MKVAFIGPDMTGKSNIAAELSRQLQIPVFKNTGEWKVKLDSENYFLNLLQYGGPFLMDFMKQTDVSVILDRFYPCELVYSQAFNRETDLDTIKWLDDQFHDAGGKFVVCIRQDYSGLVDDIHPDKLSCDMLKSIEDLYLDFLNWTRCDYTVLHTDDQDIERQISNIKEFLGVENE